MANLDQNIEDLESGDLEIRQNAVKTLDRLTPVYFVPITEGDQDRIHLALTASSMNDNDDSVRRLAAEALEIEVDIIENMTDPIKNINDEKNVVDNGRTGTFMWGVVRGIFFPVIVVKIVLCSFIDSEAMSVFKLVWDGLWTDVSDEHRVGVLIGALIFIFILAPLIMKSL